MSDESKTPEQIREAISHNMSSALSAAKEDESLAVYHLNHLAGHFSEARDAGLQVALTLDAPLVILYLNENADIHPNWQELLDQHPTRDEEGNPIFTCLPNVLGDDFFLVEDSTAIVIPGRRLLWISTYEDRTRVRDGANGLLLNPQEIAGIECVSPDDSTKPEQE